MSERVNHYRTRSRNDNVANQRRDGRGRSWGLGSGRSVLAKSGQEALFQPAAEPGGNSEAAVVAGKMDDVAGAVEHGGAVIAGPEVLVQNLALMGADVVLDVFGEYTPDIAAANLDGFSQASLFPAPRPEPDGSLPRAARRWIVWLGRGVEMTVLATSDLVRANPLATVDTDDLLFLLHGVLHPAWRCTQPFWRNPDPSDGILGACGSYKEL